jgi:uncharacterized membrane protein
MNDIGDCVLTLDRPVAADPYADNKETGSFILIDPESFDTIGMGFVQECADAGGRFARLRRALASLRFRGTQRTNVRTQESHFRSIAKAVSWRATGSLDTFIVTLFITGSSVFAGSVAVTEIGTKIVFYYFHERIWSMIPWGRHTAGGG